MADVRTDSLTKIEGGWKYETKKYGTILRTDDSHFQNLPDFAFQPHYIMFRGMRMHYLDEGASTNPNQKVALCLHGEPSWCYLYRKMIPLFVKEGYRVIAPDFLGFGRSDKILDHKAHSFNLARDSILNLIEELNLNNMTMVCQDWGGLIGLTIPMELPRNFNELIVMNTGIASGDGKLTEGFLAWRQFASSQTDMGVAPLFKRSCPHLSKQESQAYAVPYPTKDFKVALWFWPLMVPDAHDSDGAWLGRKAIKWWSTEWNGKAFMAIGKADPVLGEPPMRVLHKFIRGCAPPLILEEAGHFVQEWGDQVVPAAMESFRNPRAKL